MPPARRRTEAKPSTMDMTRAGMAEIQMEAMPTRLTRRANPPVKATKTVVAGTEPYICHLAARTERPRTMAAKMSWIARVMREASILGDARRVGSV